MGNQIILEHNIEGRKERAPLGVISYILNITGIIGNMLVIHIFRTRLTSSSNYRIFVLLLALVDLFLCNTHLTKELYRMILVYSQVTDDDLIMCQISQYIGYSVAHVSLTVALFIGIERHRKICTPFKSQITMKQSKIMCMCGVLICFAIQFPNFFFHGRRYVVVENINATRCAIKNEYDGDLLQFLYYMFLFVESLIYLVVIVKLQVSILKALSKKAKYRKKVMSYSFKSLSMRKTNETGKEPAEQEETEKNKRISRTLAIVTLLLLITFFTVTLYHTAHAARRYFVPTQKISKLEDLIAEYLPDIITFNGILNPFVYFFTDKQFNREMHKLCGRKG